MTVKSATAAAKIVFNIASMASNSRYKIKVEQLSCADTDILAPAGCVTYSDATSGSITSFNNANGAGEVRFYIILPVSFSVSYAANNKFFRR